MMGVTHRATGLAAGACVAWGVRELALPVPSTPVAVASVAAALMLTLLAGRASLWPDLDHSNSTATNSYGIISGLAHEVVEAASIACFDATATPRDRERGDFRNHRGLTHFLVTALVFGAVLGVGTWQLTARWPALALGVTVGLVATIVTPPVLSALAEIETLLVAKRRRTKWWRKRGARSAASYVVGTVVTLAVTRVAPETATVDLSLVGPALGIGVGLAVATGMLAHDLGDAATLAGVPFFWPLKIRGQRYWAFHVRAPADRSRTGANSTTEWKLRVLSRIALGVAMLGWWPGVWPWVLERVPWPWLLG